MSICTGEVYKLCSPHCQEVYIGSSTVSGAHRMRAHKRNGHKIFDYGDVVCVVLAADVPKAELKRREGEFQRAHDGPLFNKRIAGRTPAEYYRDNAERLRKAAKAQYVPKKAGGESYRQLDYYYEHQHAIGRAAAIVNARAGRNTTARTKAKYNLTDAELLGGGE